MTMFHVITALKIVLQYLLITTLSQPLPYASLYRWIHTAWVHSEWMVKAHLLGDMNHLLSIIYLALYTWSASPVQCVSVCTVNVLDMCPQHVLFMACLGSRCQCTRACKKINKLICKVENRKSKISFKICLSILPISSWNVCALYHKLYPGQSWQQLFRNAQLSKHKPVNTQTLIHMKPCVLGEDSCRCCRLCWQT